jgi:hypothetical protein
MLEFNDRGQKIYACKVIFWLCCSSAAAEEQATYYYCR